VISDWCLVDRGLRILKIVNGKKENHPLPKRRDLGFAFDSRSENHPFILHLRRKMPPLHRGEFFKNFIRQMGGVPYRRVFSPLLKRGDYPS
jgi:hypothetical protein